MKQNITLSFLHKNTSDNTYSVVLNSKRSPFDFAQGP